MFEQRKDLFSCPQENGQTGSEIYLIYLDLLIWLFIKFKRWKDLLQNSCLPSLRLQGGFIAARTENTELVNGQVSSKTWSTVTQEKIVFTVRIAEYGHRLPRKVIEFPFSAIQNLHGYLSEQIAAGGHALNRAGMRQTPEALWFCESVSWHTVYLLIGLICIGYCIKSMSDVNKRYSFSIFPIYHCYLLSCNDLLAIF